ncbi:MAG: nucleotide exchange factor GrpE [Vampirovibrionales bacterium]|nr:nucleotide exchange factor GrpE [Vampirovibrionales bacterium]
MFDSTVEASLDSMLDNEIPVNDGVTAETASETEAQVVPEPTAEERYKELYDQHLRLAADFENFRKNTRQEREALLKYGAQNTIECLLPVLDNLERGASSLSATSDPKLLYQSFTMLANQLMSELDSTGLKKMTTEGQAFDPARHEAVDQVVTSDVAENTIVRQLQSGYTLYDRVIRVAQVAVAVAPSEPADEPTFAAQANNPFTSVEA